MNVNVGTSTGEISKVDEVRRAYRSCGMPDGDTTHEGMRTRTRSRTRTCTWRACACMCTSPWRL